MSQTATKPALITVCMICKRRVSAAGHFAIGEPLAPAVNHSHGLCVSCAPGYFRDCGLSEADAQKILSKKRD